MKSGKPDPVLGPRALILLSSKEARHKIADNVAGPTASKTSRPRDRQGGSMKKVRRRQSQNHARHKEKANRARIVDPGLQQTPAQHAHVVS